MNDGSPPHRVGAVLNTAIDGLSPLHRPVMVVSLRGWFDAAGAASDALEALLGEAVAPVVAAIDPDPFFDFTQERPMVELDDDGLRRIVWPTNEFRLVRRPGEAHDLIILAGVEPHLRLATFAESIIWLAERLGCEALVTVGAAADAVPHTRHPSVVGSSTNARLAAAAGLSPPMYQGMTGLVGVLQAALDGHRLPAISLRVGIPHYLTNARHPRSSAALVAQIGRVLGLSLSTAALDTEAERWASVHDEAVADDAQAMAYVRHLEREHDRKIEAASAAGEKLAEHLERFLREQSDGDDEPPGHERGPAAT